MLLLESLLKGNSSNEKMLENCGGFQGFESDLLQSLGLPLLTNHCCVCVSGRDMRGNTSDPVQPEVAMSFLQHLVTTCFVKILRITKFARTRNSWSNAYKPPGNNAHYKMGERMAKTQEFLLHMEKALSKQRC